MRIATCLAETLLERLLGHLAMVSAVLVAQSVRPVFVTLTVRHVLPDVRGHTPPASRVPGDGAVYEQVQLGSMPRIPRGHLLHEDFAGTQIQCRV